jgi:proline iminopeptidase
MDGYIEDAYQFITQLGHADIILHGTSFGSMAALGFTVRHPKLVRRLLLVAGSPSYHFIDLAKQVLANRGDDEQKALCEACLLPGKLDAVSSLEFFRQMGPLYSYTAQEKTAGFYAMIKIHRIANLAFQNHFYHFDYTPMLNTITYLTLILARRHD